MFAGNGIMWRSIQQDRNDKINVLSIDSKTARKNVLIGDNRKFLARLDLSQFNVIDVDAYGFPWLQLRHVLLSDFIGHIYLTWIASGLSRLPTAFLIDFGYTDKMIKSAPILLSKNPLEKLKKVLPKYGIYSIDHITIRRKNYIHIHKGV